MKRETKKLNRTSKEKLSTKEGQDSKEKKRKKMRRLDSWKEQEEHAGNRFP